MVFVDTAYLVALLNRRDDLHDRATALARTWARQGTTLLTTDAVLIEFANFFCRSPLRASAITWIGRLRATPGWRIDPISRELLARAEARYAAHADKQWSLTDCVSMESMQAAGVRSIATSDAHFAQARFRVLMR